MRVVRSSRLAAIHRRLSLALAAVLVAGAAPVAWAGPGAVSVTIRALLFNARTGGFSQDVLAENGPVLGNTPLGPLASTSTFVIVTVAPRDGEIIPAGAGVRLIAHEQPGRNRGAAASRVILDRVVPLAPVDAAKASSVGFWLDHTGCRPIHLAVTVSKAAILGRGTADIPFGCYE